MILKKPFRNSLKYKIYIDFTKNVCFTITACKLQLLYNIDEFLTDARYGSLWCNTVAY